MYKRIHSILPKVGAVRLSDGKEIAKPFALIGGNVLEWTGSSKDCEASITALLSQIRPLPELIVLGLKERLEVPSILGCSIEQSDPSTAYKTFNTLLDDNRQVVGFFECLDPAKVVVTKDSN